MLCGIFTYPGISIFDYVQAVQFGKKDLCPFQIESVNKVQEPIRVDTHRVKWSFKESESLLLKLAGETSDRCEMFVFLSVN